MLTPPKPGRDFPSKPVLLPFSCCSVPALSLLVVFNPFPVQVKVSIHSGKTGQQIGSVGSLQVDGIAHYVRLQLRSSSYFLFYTGTALLGIQSARVIVAEIRGSKHLRVCFAFLQAVWSFHLIKELFGAGRRGGLLLKLQFVIYCSDFI